MDIKPDGHDWLQTILANNPSVIVIAMPLRSVSVREDVMPMRVDLNPQCYTWTSKLRLNNPSDFARRVKNPTDYNHPLGDQWYRLGVNCPLYKIP